MISATGIGSGLDIDGIVTQLVAAERSAADTRLFSSEAEITAELSAFGQFKGALSSLESAVADLNSVSTFRGKTISSADEDVVGVSVTSSATPANYNLSVSQLATTHSLASSSFENLDDELGTGTITLQFGTTDYTSPDPGPESYDSFSVNGDVSSVSITIDETNNTLEGIRDAINDADVDATAVIVNDGSGYRLLLNSTNTGAENSLEVTVDDTGDGDDIDDAGLSRFAFNSSAVNMEQTIEAQDAVFSVNGIEISSDSNEVTEAVEGVTLSLESVSETGTSVSIGVGHDTDRISSAVQGFVSAYNGYVATLNAVASYDATSGTGGSLQGDFTVRNVTSRLRELVSGGALGTSNEFSYLIEIGISTEADGSLSLDQSTLNEAIEENVESLETLFSAVGNSSNNGMTYITSSADTAVGDYEVVITQPATQALITSAVMTFPLTIDEDNDDFQLTVNDETSNTISLTHGTYTGDELAAIMQTQINEDDDLSDASKTVEVIFDSATNQIQINTTSYGSDTNLTLVTADSGFVTDFGYTVGTEVEGLDVAGTIGGDAAVGEGQTLEAGLGTAAEGLSILVEADTAGSLGDMQYSRGIADQLESLIAIYVDSEGLIDSRTESLNTQIEDIEDQREQLEIRMDAYEDGLRAQYNALDSLLASLDTTSNFLTTALASLPGARNSDS